jgi:hypothetical protein
MGVVAAGGLGFRPPVARRRRREERSKGIFCIHNFLPRFRRRTAVLLQMTVKYSIDQ